MDFFRGRGVIDFLEIVKQFWRIRQYLQKSITK